MTTTSKKRLTNQLLEKISTPKSGRLEIADELCPGLIFGSPRVGPNRSR